jgi:hypothetical protein
MDPAFARIGLKIVRRMKRDSNKHTLKAVLTSGNVRAAIAYLNSLTAYRFTSLYRFDVGTLRNVTFFDRENPGTTKCEDIPVEASYCVFVRDLNATFLLQDAEHDDRVRAHPKRATI